MEIPSSFSFVARKTSIVWSEGESFHFPRIESFVRYFEAFLLAWTMNRSSCDDNIGNKKDFGGFMPHDCTCVILVINYYLRLCLFSGIVEFIQWVLFMCTHIHTGIVFIKLFLIWMDSLRQLVAKLCLRFRCSTYWGKPLLIRLYEWILLSNKTKSIVYYKLLNVSHSNNVIWNWKICQIFHSLKWISEQRDCVYVRVWVRNQWKRVGETVKLCHTKYVTIIDIFVLCTRPALNCVSQLSHKSSFHICIIEMQNQIQWNRSIPAFC